MDYESRGQRFESFRARHFSNIAGPGQDMKVGASHSKTLGCVGFADAGRAPPCFGRPVQCTRKWLQATDDCVLGDRQCVSAIPCARHAPSSEHGKPKGMTGDSPGGDHPA